MAQRYVKLGRRLLDVTVGHSWAVQVEDYVTCASSEDLCGYWYEIGGADDGGCENSSNMVNKSYGSQAQSGAGALGGELVGKTYKTDDQIGAFVDNWLNENPTYDITNANCQKFAIQFIAWLTDNNFKLPHGLDAGTIPDLDKYTRVAVAHGGQAFAAIGAEKRVQKRGLLRSAMRGPYVEAEAIAGPGLGAWANASAARLETNFGNVAQVHLDASLNTGAGIRGGNLDVHLLGFGGRVGTDGLEINTPLAGGRLPWATVPINLIGNLLKH